MILQSFILFIFLALKACFGALFLENKCLVNFNLTSQFLTEYVDLKVNKCKNFYKFACGTWLKDIKEINYCEKKKFYYKNVYDFEHFKIKAFRGDYDHISPAIAKINKLTEKCELGNETQRIECLEKVYHFGFYAYASLFIKEIEEVNDNGFIYDIIEGLLDANIHELKQLIENRKSFLSTIIRRNFYKKLNLLTLYRGHHQRLKNVRLMEKCYKYFEFSMNGTYEDMLSSINSYYCMVPEDEDDRDLCYNYLINHRSGNVNLTYLVNDNTYYHYETNRFIVNPAIIRHPCFDCRLTKALQYGCIGTIIGQQLIKTLDYYLRTHEYVIAAEKNNNATTLIEKTYYNKRNCFYRKYDLNNKNIVIKSGIKDDIIDNIVADNGGISLSHKAYKKYLKDLSGKNEGVVPGFETFTGEQLFFISYAKSFCEDFRDKYFTSPVKPKFGLSGSTRFLMSSTNYDFFAKAYKCDLGTSLNPKIKCTLW